MSTSSLFHLLCHCFYTTMCNDTFEHPTNFCAAPQHFIIVVIIVWSLLASTVHELFMLLLLSLSLTLLFFCLTVSLSLFLCYCLSLSITINFIYCHKRTCIMQPLPLCRSKIMDDWHSQAMPITAAWAVCFSASTYVQYFQ